MLRLAHDLSPNGIGRRFVELSCEILEAGMKAQFSSVLLWKLSNSGNPSVDQSKQTDAMSYLIAQRSEEAFPFRVIHDRQRIIEMPVYEFGLRKTGAFRPRTITQRDHEVEAIAQNVVRGFCSPSSKINTDLLHHLDRKRMSLSTVDACASNVKMLRIHSVQQCLRHRTLHTVGRAQE
jgi:hypothetical protein